MVCRCNEYELIESAALIVTCRTLLSGSRSFQISLAFLISEKPGFHSPLKRRIKKRQFTFFPPTFFFRFGSFHLYQLPNIWREPGSLDDHWLALKTIYCFLNLAEISCSHSSRTVYLPISLGYCNFLELWSPLCCVHSQFNCRHSSTTDSENMHWFALIEEWAKLWRFLFIIKINWN